MADLDEEEVWAPVVGWPAYSVSNMGRVKRVVSHKRGIAGTILKTRLAFGYPVLVLCRPDGSRKTSFVHRLVAEAFIPNPCGLREVNHIDGSRDNNRLSNLEWVSSSGNRAHAYKIGRLRADGEHNGQAKLTETQVIAIRSAVVSCPSDTVELASQYCVSRATIYDIRARRSWASV